jgi:hypothetical protein
LRPRRERSCLTRLDERFRVSDGRCWQNAVAEVQDMSKAAGFFDGVACGLPDGIFGPEQ